jgi:hypothetical protein
MIMMSMSMTIAMTMMTIMVMMIMITMIMIMMMMMTMTDESLDYHIACNFVNDDDDDVFNTFDDGTLNDTTRAHSNSKITTFILIND